MNVIFLDFDGVLDTFHYSSNEDIEKKVIILANICKEYNCNVVIEASAKGAIDEETLELYNDWIKFIFDLFKKYGIKCIGRTPSVSKKLDKYFDIPMWKDYEIRLYLFRHPEIEHFCIIDDDDLYPNSDLRMLNDYLVKTKNYSKEKKEEGLLDCHIEEVGKILKKENKIRNLVLKYKKRTIND